jgi:hypothetical protein
MLERGVFELPRREIPEAVVCRRRRT